MQKGLTLIELLMVVALLGILTVGSLAVLAQSNDKQKLKAATEQLADSLRRANIQAQKAVEDKTWGVETVTATEYRLVGKLPDGTVTPKQTISLPSPIVFSSLFTVWFQKGEGGLTVPAAVTLQTPKGILGKITISETGVVTTTFH